MTTNVFTTEQYIGSDASRIQQALTAAAAAIANNTDEFATVVLDAPVYSVSIFDGFLIPSQIRIESPIRALIKNSYSYLDADGGTYITGVVFVPEGDDISIRNVRFEAVGTKQSPAAVPPQMPLSYGEYRGCLAIYQIAGGNRLVIEDCEFTNYPNAIYFSGNATNNQESDANPFPGQVRVSNNIIHGGTGLLLRCFKELLFSGNISDLITDNTDDPSHQLYVTDRSASRSGALTVTACIDYNTLGLGESWKVRNVSNVVIVGCNSYLASRGIIANYCDNVTISACRIGQLRPGINGSGVTDTEAAGIQLWDCPNSIVSDCVVSTTQDVNCYRVSKDTSAIYGAELPTQTDGSASIILPATFAAALTDWTGIIIKVYSGAGAGQKAIITSYDATTYVATFATALESPVDSTSYIGSYDERNENMIFRDCTAVVAQESGYGKAILQINNGGNVSVESFTILYQSDVVSSRAFYVTNAHNVLIDRPRIFGQPITSDYDSNFIYFTPLSWDNLVILDPTLVPSQAITAGINLGSAANVYYMLPTQTQTTSSGNALQLSGSSSGGTIVENFTYGASGASITLKSQGNIFFNVQNPTLQPARITSNGVEIQSGFYLLRTVAIVTPSGSTYSTATALTATHNIIVSATAGTGVQLPPAVTGKECTVRNHSTAAIKVYPPTSGELDLGTVNVPITLSGGTTMTFVAQSSGQWYS